MSRERCDWADGDDLLRHHHDTGRGVPLRDDRTLFIGGTICYAFLQAAGMVNDDLTGCFRYRQVARAARP